MIISDRENNLNEIDNIQLQRFGAMRDPLKYCLDDELDRVDLKCWVDEKLRFL
jgi:hypothetical protein